MAETYTVTSITPTTTFDATNTAVRGTEVAFETVPNKIAGVVRFEVAEPTPAEVDEAIRPQAARLESIKAL